MRKISLLLTVFLLLSMVAFPFAVYANEDGPLLTIEKEPYCMKPPGDYDSYSNNGPYTVGIKYYWWINITVKNVAGEALDNVVVFDRLGGEFMIEGICVDTPKQPDDLKDYPGTIPAGFVFAPFDYDFVYNGGSPYEPLDGEPVEILDNTATAVTDGLVNDDGVTFDGFTISWTGKSCKAHFMWEIGSMADGEVKTIFLVISTDLNPKGHQEFTSPGIYYLNSGATVKALEEKPSGKLVPFFSASTEPIMIEVTED